MRALGLLLGLATLASGCTTTAEVSSGYVGCPADEIVVSNEKSSWSARTWTATCRGRTFHCVSRGGGEDHPSEIACNALQDTTVPGGANAAPPTNGGCSYDTQCKGDRVCEAGQCVSPPAAAPGAVAPEATPPAT